MLSHFIIVQMVYHSDTAKTDVLFQTEIFIRLQTDVNSNTTYLFNVQVERLSVEDLSSRLTLNANAVAVTRLLLSDSFITLMDVCSQDLMPCPFSDVLFYKKVCCNCHGNAFISGLKKC